MTVQRFGNARGLHVTIVLCNPQLIVLSQYVTAFSDPHVFVYFSPISYVRTHNTNEGNTYANNPDPTNSDRKYSPIIR